MNAGSAVLPDGGVHARIWLSIQRKAGSVLLRNRESSGRHHIRGVRPPASIMSLPASSHGRIDAFVGAWGLLLR